MWARFAKPRYPLCDISARSDQTTTAGFSIAAVGAVATAPVGGEGGLPGLTVVAVGSFFSNVGKGSEVIVKLIADDYSEGAADAATYITGEAASYTINKLLHIPQSATPYLKSLFNIGKETTRNLASDKTVSTIKELRK